jgi:hypothetical protein
MQIKCCHLRFFSSFAPASANSSVSLYSELWCVRCWFIFTFHLPSPSDRCCSRLLAHQYHSGWLRVNLSFDPQTENIHLMAKSKWLLHSTHRRDTHCCLTRSHVTIKSVARDLGGGETTRWRDLIYHRSITYTKRENENFFPADFDLTSYIYWSASSRRSTPS